MVGAHPVLLEPRRRVRAEAERLADGLGERLAGVGLEPEPRAGGAVPRHDGVAQPADGVDHRHGAVAHRVQLPQPARLLLRRHPEHVAGAVEPVRERLVEGERQREPAGRGGRGHAPQRALVLGVAGAQHRHRGVGLGEHARHAVGEHRRALLGRQAAHVDEQRAIRVEAELGAHGALGGGLAAEVVGRERVREVRVRGRVPHPRVDAVDDAAQAPRRPPEGVVEPVRRLRPGGELGGVARADGRDAAGPLDARLEAVDAAEVVQRGAVRHGHADGVPARPRHLAVVVGAVDGEHGRELAEGRVGGVGGEQRRDEARVVVVEVQQVRRPDERAIGAAVERRVD